jgi:hypothetical protein
MKRRHDSIAALASRTSTDESRAAAAIVLGTSGNASPDQFAVYLQYWLQLFLHAEDSMMSGDVLAAIVRKRGAEFLSKKVLFVNPKQTFSRFEEALRRNVSPWNYIGGVLEALEAAVATPVAVEIRRTLVQKIESERQWLYDR